MSEDGRRLGDRPRGCLEKWMTLEGLQAGRLVLISSRALLYSTHRCPKPLRECATSPVSWSNGDLLKVSEIGK